jgi:hypothetical protein
MGGLRADLRAGHSLVPSFQATHRCVLLCLPEFHKPAPAKKSGYTIQQIYDMVAANIAKHGARFPNDVTVALGGSRSLCRACVVCAA